MKVLKYGCLGVYAYKIPVNLPSRIWWATLSVAKRHWSDSTECDKSIPIPHTIYLMPRSHSQPLTAAYSLLMPLTAATSPPTAKRITEGGVGVAASVVTAEQNAKTNVQRQGADCGGDTDSDSDSDGETEANDRKRAATTTKTTLQKNAAAKQTTRLGSEFASFPCHHLTHTHSHPSAVTNRK